MSRLAEPATLCFAVSLLSRLLSSSTPAATFQVLWKCRSHPSRNDALVVKRTSRPARTGTHGIPETGCGGPRGRPDPVFRRARFVRTTHPKAALARLAPHRRPLAYREEEGGPPLGRPYPFGFLFGLSLRETRGGFESTMNPAWLDGLHMPLETPGCEALEAACDDGACRGR